MLKQLWLLLLTIYSLHSTLFSLSLEEKIGQLLLAHFHGEQANEDARVLVQELGVGGIIYYNWANGLSSPEQVQALSCSLQKLAKESAAALPLFIAIDQEGGSVTRLNNGFTQFPGNRIIGAAQRPDLAEAAACAMGEELQAVGINLNFAPVVDILTNPHNPAIGLRTYGDDPETVAFLGARALQGFKQASIIATLKHFPGHGDAAADSHLELPLVNKSLEELERTELVPFSKLASSADLIMTAHLLVPALDKDNCSTLSENTLTYLRETLGFQGAVITDSLAMEGVLRGAPIEEAAVRALIAGCDILLLGGKRLQSSQDGFELTFKEIRQVKQAILQALQSGRLSEKRIEEAFQRVVRLKEKYLNFKLLDQPPLLSQWVNTPEHRRIAQEIFSLSLNFSIPKQLAKQISEKIWKNECAGNPDSLTNWKQGENHASLGIGHFIWYPSEKKEPFQETFPALVEFLKEEGAEIPDSLQLQNGCPWSSREQFYTDFHSDKMEKLRQFLFDTRDLQAFFMAKRLEKTLPLMLEQCRETEREKIALLFFSLLRDANGLYALLDYLNFKGDGISPQEAYKGEKWGLLRVLQSIPHTSKKPIRDFVHSAKTLLKQRVENAAAERQEERWLHGWFKRLDTYLGEF